LCQTTFVEKNIYSLCLTWILLWIPYSIIKGRYTAEMGSKHEITIHIKPLFFFIILSAKKDHRVLLHTEKHPHPPTSCKSNSFLFMVIEHNFSVRCTLNNRSNSLGNLFFIFMIYSYLGDSYRVAKNLSTTRRI